MNKFKGNKFFTALVVSGVLLFAIIAFIVIRSTSTVTAVVPNQQIAAGTKIDETMIQTIQVPSNTPGGFITDKASLIGQKLKVSVDQNQLLYISNIMASWDNFSEGESIPDDYVVTSIQIPANRAVGGLITVGDTVDILGVPNSEYKTTSKETLDNYLGNMAQDSYGANGMNVYWVLSNVKILETDSTLSQTNESSISTVTEESSSNSEGDYYIVALSYNDYKKLRLSEQYLDLWMSITPEKNSDEGADLDLMKESTIQSLQDAQKQSGRKPTNAKTETKEEKQENSTESEQAQENVEENVQDTTNSEQEENNENNE